ncbi:MAG: hypothetical protein P4L34_00675 [Paludibacter sp.]|nr:hypothetical protein [Paludibacter sp.]
MKRLIQLTLLGVLSLFANAFAQVSSSKWQSQPIVIDGDGSDWGTLPRFFNADSNVKYEFRNDAQNLYIILNAADRATQMQFIRAGFNVKLRVKTSPPLKVGIAFLPSRMKIMSPPSNNQDKLADKTETDPGFMPKDTAIADGFQYGNGKIAEDGNDVSSICFAHSKSMHDQGTYEIRIPLRDIFGNNFSLETVSDTPIQLQVNIDALTKNQNNKMKSRMGSGRGMHGGGMGEQNGMGMGNEGGRSGMGEAPGSETRDQMQGEDDGYDSTMRGVLSMERKSFSIDFKLSTGK